MKKLAAYNLTFVVLLLVFVLVAFIGSGKAVETVRKKETVNAFKAVYAGYSNALLQTVAQMLGDTGCFYSIDPKIPHEFSGCDAFYKEFVSNMKVKKYCHGNAFEDGCIPEYQSYITKNQCIGFSKEMLNKHNDVFVLDNGSNVIVYNVKKDDRRPIFAVDINGLLSPNKAGEDLFSMTIVRNSNGAYYFHPNVSHCLPIEEDAIENLVDIYK